MSISNSLATPTDRSWNVTGCYPLRTPEIPSAEPTDCMQCIVAWLRNDETPLILKAGAVFGGFIATIAVGFAIGYPFSSPRLSCSPQQSGLYSRGTN
ncbi:MAG: hypothetical protein JSR93_01670 [Verrucomicrobia bacterium]|nr:hypothetical protein [Verrucomicrobiota bacterium]